MVKRSVKYFSFMVFMVAGLASCSTDLYDVGDTSPEVLIAEYAQVNSDTVRYGINANHTAYTLDSIQVRDTLSVYLAAYSYSSYLKAIYTTVSDSNYLKLLEPNDSVKSIFSSTSNFKTGELYLPENVSNHITYTMRVVPIKSADKVTITIGAVNAATDVSNAFETKIEFPVKGEKK